MQLKILKINSFIKIYVIMIENCNNAKHLIAKIENNIIYIDLFATVFKIPR